MDYITVLLATALQITGNFPRNKTEEVPIYTMITLLYHYHFNPVSMWIPACIVWVFLFDHIFSVHFSQWGIIRQLNIPALLAGSGVSL